YGGHEVARAKALITGILASGCLVIAANAKDTQRINPGNPQGGPTILQPQRAPRASGAPSIQTAPPPCFLNCGSSVGSTSCLVGQTCNCSCNRQPICQCR